MGRLERKIALITGGTSAIGLATATRFVNEGAYVFVKGRREQELAAAERTRDELPAGPALHPDHCRAGRRRNGRAMG